MAHSFDDAHESRDPPDDEPSDGVFTNRVERFVVAGAIIGPLLLALVTWLRRDDVMSPLYGSWAAFHFFEVFVIQGLTIWLAWRHPILGGKTIPAILVALLIQLAILFSHWSSLFVGEISGPSFMASYIVASRIGLFLVQIAVLVLMRRLFQIVLVKRGEPKTYRPNRLSIRELMLWTLVIAIYMAFHLGLTRWAQANTSMVRYSVPVWFVVYSIFASYLPPALLVVAIVYCKRFSVLIWLPLVLTIYLLGSYANSVLTRIVYEAYLDIGMKVGWGIGLRELANSSMFVLLTLLVVWSFRRIGYQFQQGAQL